MHATVLIKPIQQTRVLLCQESLARPKKGAGSRSISARWHGKRVAKMLTVVVNLSLEVWLPERLEVSDCAELIAGGQSTEPQGNIGPDHSGSMTANPVELIRRMHHLQCG